MRWQSGSRRMFLRGAGQASLAIPFLPSLLRGGDARAAGPPPRRFIAIKSYSAQTLTDWYPVTTANGYRLKNTVFPAILPGDNPGVRENARQDGTTHLTRMLLPGETATWAPLSDFKTPSVSRLLGPGYNRFLDKTLLLRGLDFLPDTNHNDGGMLGNFAGSNSSVAQALPHWPTIDQVMAYSSKLYPTAPALRSLHLSPGSFNSVSYTDDGKRGGPVRQVQARVNPQVAYLDVFGSLTATPTTAKRRGVDGVIEDFRRTLKHKRLSGDDRLLLDRHVSFLAELQNDIAAGAPVGGCAARPAAPQSIANNPPGGNLEAVADIQKTYDLMIDVLAAAVMCDQTRIVTLDIRKALATIDGSTSGYHHLKDAPGSWHGEAHNWGIAASDRVVFEINRWISESIVRKVLEKLDVIEGEGRTYLDNALVMWGNELGFSHIGLSVPTVLFGSNGGHFATGRYVDYIDWNSRLYFGQLGGAVIRGLPYNRLLVSIMQSMGLAPADYERAAGKGFGETKTVGKTAGAWPTDYNLDQIGNPLPGLTV